MVTGFTLTGLFAEDKLQKESVHVIVFCFFLNKNVYFVCFFVNNLIEHFFFMNKKHLITGKPLHLNRSQTKQLFSFYYVKGGKYFL